MSNYLLLFFLVSILFFLVIIILKIIVKEEYYRKTQNKLVFEIGKNLAKQHRKVCLINDNGTIFYGNTENKFYKKEFTKHWYFIILAETEEELQKACATARFAMRCFEEDYYI